MWKFLFLSVGLLFSVHGAVYHDPELEAIVIDDSVEIDFGSKQFVRPEEDETATTLSPHESCTTATGVGGKCIPLRDCFPYVDYLMQQEAETISSYMLEIVNSTEKCPEEDGLICCPNYAYQRLPSKKPSVLPQFPTPTTTKPVVNGSVTTPTTTKAPSGIAAVVDKPKESCGSYLKWTDDLVVGGRVAKRGEFPWTAALLMNGRQFCGGSIIKNNWILTAAHCVQSLRDTSGVRVALGAYDVGNAGELGREVRGLTKVLYHRDFSMQHLGHDVALLQLNSPVQYSSYIQPVCLNSQDITFPQKADLAGWGKTGNTQPPARTLRTVNMALITPSDCKRKYQGTNAPPFREGMVCAGESSPLKDACNGDSGGPLTINDGTKATQIGIVSWGIGCGEKPGVYTRVDKYLPWITKNSK